MEAQQSRIVLLAACIGAATHISHGRHLVNHLIETHGRNTPINVGGTNVDVEAPMIRLVCGIKPKTLADLETVLDYLETQVTELLAAAIPDRKAIHLILNQRYSMPACLIMLALS